MKKNEGRLRKTESGFSILELIVVLAVIAVLSVMSYMAIGAGRKYAADDQAMNIFDLFQEARQKALNERQTMRVEINASEQEVRLIDENVQADAGDDQIIRRVRFTRGIVTGLKPSSITNIPTASYPIPEMTYTQSTYPLSSTNQTFTLRYLRNGQVVDKGTTSTGAGAVVTGATVYIYSLNDSGTSLEVIRALTVAGSTGDVAILKCIKSNDDCTSWRR